MARDQRGMNWRVSGPTNRGKAMVVYASFRA